MSAISYPGTSYNVVHSLAIESLAVQVLERAPEWIAPAKVQLLGQEDGVIYHEFLIENPQPRIVGTKLNYDYNIDFVVPDIPKGFYSIVLTRHFVQSTLQLVVDGVSVDAYGAEDVLCLNTDSSVDFALKDHNPQASVEWALSFKRVTSDVASMVGPTTKHLDGADAYFVHTGFNPFNEGVPASLEPITIVWTVQDTPARKRKQVSSLYVINNSQLTIVNELKNFFDRLSEERRLPSLEYSLADFCRWMRQGMDMFNGGGLFTTFNMTNATGAIKYWWFTCSIICALRNMYLLEGQRSFSFSGQSVTLDVDITNYLQSVMSDLQSSWDSDKLSFKQQLKQYGLSGGDGNMDYARFQAGAVGLSLGPASNFGGFYGARNILGGMRFY